MRSLLRFLAPMLGLAILLGLLAPVPAASAAPASGDWAHPYSNPVWWPLGSGSSSSNAPTRFGCYRGNPGCTNPTYHPGWGLDLRVDDNDNRVPVYAVGAGIVHIGQDGLSCNGTGGRGNYVYIDHGAGVVSYYAHLLKGVRVSNGQYVSARTALGYVGNTGYSGCRAHPHVRYVFVALKHGGTNGQYVEMTHLWACVRGAQQSWPAQHPTNRGSQWTRLNDIPNLTTMPAADVSRSCIPAPPATATRPIRVTLRRYSSTVLTGSWAAPGSRYHVVSGRAELQEYHPSIRRYLSLRVHSPSATATRTSFTRLVPGHRYRFTMQFLNAAGHSRWSPWVYYTLPR